MLGVEEAGVIRYGANTLWMVLERLASLGTALITGIVLARYLGAAEFGLLQYALSFCALFGLIANLGMDSLLMRDLISRQARTGILLGTVAVMRVVAAVLALFFVVLTSRVAGHSDDLSWMILIIALAFLPQFMSVVEVFCLAHVRAREPMRARIAAALVTLGFVLLGVQMQAGIGYFAAYPLFEAFVVMLVLAQLYSRGNNAAVPFEFDAATAKAMLREAWPLTVSFGLIAIYSNLDKLLVRHFLGDEAIGVFAVASRLTEALYFLPTVIVGSLFPAIIRSREAGGQHYRLRMQKLYDLMVVLGAAIALPTAIFAEDIIVLLYGNSYREAGAVLSIQMVFFAVVSVAVALGRWMMLEGLTGMFLLRSGIGVLGNLLLNVTLTPRYGLEGAAWAGGLAHVLVLASPALVSHKCRSQIIMTIRSLTFWSLGSLIKRKISIAKE